VAMVLYAGRKWAVSLRLRAGCVNRLAALEEIRDNSESTAGHSVMRGRLEKAGFVETFRNFRRFLIFASAS
jgi:hypothetical protein